jgi:type IV pilus assembly protein PilA
MSDTQRRGFTFIEVLIVVIMAIMLAAIGLPRFLQAQKRAKKSEAITQLKTLHAAMSSQAVRPISIHVPGFNPPRGNHYSYHLSDFCTSWEDRSTEWAVWNDYDDCIGVDSYANPGYPSFFTPMPIPGVSWDMDGLVNGMSTSAGIYGGDTNWDYLAYAAGDIDKDPSDGADTWSIASADAQIVGICPGSGIAEFLPAGEPFHVNDDGDKDCY